MAKNLLQLRTKLLSSDNSKKKIVSRFCQAFSTGVSTLDVNYKVGVTKPLR